MTARALQKHHCHKDTKTRRKERSKILMKLGALVPSWKLLKDWAMNSNKAICNSQPA